MLKKLFKYIGIVLLVLTALVLISGAVLIMRWPWWFSAFMLLGLTGLGLLAYILRKVWLRKREQKFLKESIMQDAQLVGNERKHIIELQERFKQAIATLKRSHLKKRGNPLHVLPWYLVIGESGSGKTTAIKSARLSTPFAGMVQDTGGGGTRNLDWWFFEQAVLLDTAGRYTMPVDEERDGEEWQRLLQLLAKYRKSEALNGLVVTVPADRLLQACDGELEEDGKRIRRRIGELMRMLGCTFPVYVLISKCDLVQGMTRFCHELGEEVARQAFGVLNQDLSQDYPDFIARGLHELGERLAGLRLMILNRIEARHIDPALVLFPEEFARLRRGIEAFARGAFQVNPYQETPMLRGLYFSSGRQEGTPHSHFLTNLELNEHPQPLTGGGKGLFLHDFFARILPRERGLLAPTRRALAWNRQAMHLGLMSWLTIGVALCGILSVGFIKNVGIIRGVPAEFTRPLVFQGEPAADLAAMERLSKAVRRLEEQNANWWMPRLGLLQSRHLEDHLKSRYCELFTGRFLTHNDKQLGAELKNMEPADPRVGEYIIHLISRINLLKTRLNGADMRQALMRPQAVLVLAGQSPQSSKLLADLYGCRLMWDTDSDALRKEYVYLISLLSEAVAKGADFRWLPAWINTDPGLKPVVLEEFWGGSVSLENEIRVEPAYTVEGKRKVDAFLADLESTLTDIRSFVGRKLDFQIWYKTMYLNAWQDFIQAFPTGVGRLKTRDEWHGLAVDVANAQGAHLRFLKRLTEELRPYRQDAAAPPWVSSVFAFEMIQNSALALDSSGNSKVQQTASRIKGSIETRMRAGRAQVRLGENPELVLAAPRAYKEYDELLAKVSQTVTGSRAAAFQIATQTFSEDPSASPFTAVQKELFTLQHAGNLPADLLWNIVKGPLDLLWQYTCLESASQLQAAWIKYVVADSQGITDPAQLGQLLFAPEGLATKFIKVTAAPFVDRNLKGYYAREALGRTVPFEPQFLQYISQAKAGISLEALAAAGGETTVTIRGLPTDANGGAKIQPHATRLQIQCGSQVQTLVNLNYPVSKVFSWSPGCKNVMFSIEVGDLVLERNYTGSDAFARFLTDFGGGSHVFYPKDFPGQTDALKSLGITYIRAKYKFGGHNEIINRSRLSMAQPKEVPLSIVRCEF